MLYGPFHILYSVLYYYLCFRFHCSGESILLIESKTKATQRVCGNNTGPFTINSSEIIVYAKGIQSQDSPHVFEMSITGWYTVTVVNGILYF